jgi:hypothetical protein
VKSIVDHCGDDFNICLIDDDSFSKLIPSWNFNMNSLTEPLKSNVREYGITMLLYIYGGIVVPNSFVCLKNLMELYERAISNNKPFIMENINYSADNAKKRMTFVPDISFMGALKNDTFIREMLDYMKKRNSNSHISSEDKFLGTTAQWCIKQIDLSKMTLMGGEIIGTKTNKKTPIILDDLMGEEFLQLHGHCLGIYIPNNQVLHRIKYQWFSVLSCAEILKTNTVVSKLLKVSMVDKTNVKEIKSSISSF